MDTKKIFFKKVLPIAMAFFFFNLPGIAQKIVRYDLYIQDTTLNLTGKTKKAIAVNGQIPMPTLVFTEGDTAEIHVHNNLKVETSLHWHGLFLPNKEDGVPFLTQMPIKPRTTYIYRFPIIQNGTHWYHSHSGLQEQLGMYGTFIMLKKPEDPRFRVGIDDLPAIPIILSDWTDYKPENVHRMLHTASDWFAIQKKSTQNYLEAIKSGHFKTKIKNEWKRMLPMDVSDIYYQKVLMNGKLELELKEIQEEKLKAGSKIRLRIANGASSTYFWLRYAGGKITVVASDGNDVEPVAVDRLLIAVAETYDIIVTIPYDSASFELQATSEDHTQFASYFFGNGKQVKLTPLPKLNYFEGMMMMNEEENHHHHHSSPMVTLNYAMLRSPVKTNLPENAPLKVLKFELTGNMNRYVWSMNNKVVSEAKKILIKKGENLRLIIHNASMMRHPMHLHGHDFRVINGNGDFAPLKNTIDIMPMETDTLDFHANAEGDWFFHCHILYHMMSGMGRVFSYENQEPNNLIANDKKAKRKFNSEDRKTHFMIENDLATNGNDGELMVQNTRWILSTEWRLGYNNLHGFETETHIGRFLGQQQWLKPFIGFDWRYRDMGTEKAKNNLFGQTNTKDKRAFLSLGVNYTLPMLLSFQAEIFTDGILRIQIGRDDVPITNRLRWNFMVNSDKEFMTGVKYIISRNISATTHYDSDMGAGLGISFRY